MFYKNLKTKYFDVATNNRYFIKTKNFLQLQCCIFFIKFDLLRFDRVSKKKKQLKEQLINHTDKPVVNY